jgi:mycothiol synthase
MNRDVLETHDVSPAKEADLDEVVRFVEGTERELGFPDEPIREEMVWTWHLPTTDLERDTRLVRDGADLVAYAEGTWHPERGGPLVFYVAVHTEHRGRGLGTWLAGWAEDLAERRGSEGVRSIVADRDERAHELLRARGYRHVRSGYAMRKQLSTGEEPGPAPDGVAIRGYEDADEITLYELHQAAFAEHWGFRPSSLESFNAELHAEDWDPSLVSLAEVGEKAVGYVVPLVFRASGYVAILGVLDGWRGRGIGTTLLHRSFADLAERGVPEVRLHVDTQNVHNAVELYERAGMTVHRRHDIFDLGTPEAAAAAEAGARSTAVRG